MLGLSPPQMVTAAAGPAMPMSACDCNAVTADEPTYPLHRDRACCVETQAARSLRSRRARSRCRVDSPDADFDIHDYEALLDVSAELGARHVIAQGADSDLERVDRTFRRSYATPPPNAISPPISSS